MTKTKKARACLSKSKLLSTELVRIHLLQLADGAYAKAERSRRSWYRARRTKTR